MAGTHGRIGGKLMLAMLSATEHFATSKEAAIDLAQPC
jgi:hypothetical protein